MLSAHTEFTKWEDNFLIETLFSMKAKFTGTKCNTNTDLFSLYYKLLPLNVLTYEVIEVK